jgi:hypothetical protein
MADRPPGDAPLPTPFQRTRDFGRCLPPREPARSPVAGRVGDDWGNCPPPSADLQAMIAGNDHGPDGPVGAGQPALEGALAGAGKSTTSRDLTRSARWPAPNVRHPYGDSVADRRPSGGHLESPHRLAPVAPIATRHDLAPTRSPSGRRAERSPSGSGARGRSTPLPPGPERPRAGRDDRPSESCGCSGLTPRDDQSRKGMIRRAMMLAILIIGLMAGPAVSL